MAAAEGFGRGGDSPGALSRSSTLPCFSVLAGLNGPSNSSVLLVAVGFTVDTGTTVSSLVNSAEPEHPGLDWVAHYHNI